VVSDVQLWDETTTASRKSHCANEHTH